MVIHGKCCHFHSTLCLSTCKLLVKQDRVRLGCHSWPVWEELVPSEPANERPQPHPWLSHENIQSMMANTKNGHRSTAPSIYQTHHSFYKIFQYFELYSSEPVFEIAWWTGARDQQKQHRSSKTTVFAGPKDQQLVLYKTVWWFKFSVVFHVALPLEITIKSFWLLTYFFGPPQLIPDHQR